MEYRIKIKRIPHPRYKTLVRIDKWCDQYCCGNWQHGESPPYQGANSTMPDLTVYEFENPKDAVLFKLEWI